MPESHKRPMPLPVQKHGVLVRHSAVELRTHDATARCMRNTSVTPSLTIPEGLRDICMFRHKAHQARRDGLHNYFGSGVVVSSVR